MKEKIIIRSYEKFTAAYAADLSSPWQKWRLKKDLEAKILALVQ